MTLALDGYELNVLTIGTLKMPSLALPDGPID